LTSSSKILTLVLLLLLPLTLSASTSVMQRGNLTLDPGGVWNDVVIADGNLTIAGRVEGEVFVVNGKVLVRSGALVRGNLTVMSGDLRLEPGAEVEGEINVLSGQAVIDPGAHTSGKVQALGQVSSLTPEKLALVSRHMIFPREVPPAGFPLTGLANLDAGALGLRQVRDDRTDHLSLLELGIFPTRGDDIEGARMLVYQGQDAWVLVSAVRFSSPDAAESFWNNLRGRIEERTSSSVHNGLGDGAHWFFRHRHSSYCLWYQDRTLMAVTVRQEQHNPGPADWAAAEELRDRVISGLAALYRPAPGTANGSHK
jgi:hypothetical protein